MFWYFFQAVNFPSFIIGGFPEKFGNFKFFVTKKKIGMLGFHVEVDPRVGRKFLLAKTDVCTGYCVVWLLLAVALGGPIIH